MAVTYFVTKTFVNSEVNTETSNRIREDNEIKGKIKTVSDDEALINDKITALNAKVSSFEANFNLRVGTGTLNDSIVFPETYVGTREDNSHFAGTKARNVLEGLNALSGILEAHMNTFDNTTDLQALTTLTQQVTDFTLEYNAQVKRIDDILELAPIVELNGQEETIDTFSEVVALINQIANASSSSEAFTTYQSEITTALSTKAEKVQDINTETVYLDNANNNTPYKLYISNGLLVIENI